MKILIVAKPPQNSVQQQVAVHHRTTQPTQACSVISFFYCKVTDGLFIDSKPVCNPDRYAKCRLKREELENLWGQKQNQVAQPPCGEKRIGRIECIMNFCTNCEGGRPHRKPERGTAICEGCGTENEIPWVPLLVITGGGGCGKTAVTQNLLRKQNPYVVIEADYLLGGREAFDSWDSYWNYVAIVSRTLAKNQRPIVLVGWVPPSLIEKTASSKYFSAVHFLVLTCDPEIQTERLNARYRFGNSEPPPPESITNALNGTNHILEEANSRSNATVLDTTNLTQYETTSMVDRWILERLDR